MTTAQLDSLSYPIGSFVRPATISTQKIQEWIQSIRLFPVKLQSEVGSLMHEQLDWRYRPEGWTIQQIVHHCADSHINSQIRFKLALTEDKPTIKPYLEAKWALLSDTTDAPVEWSLDLLNAVHKKWVFLLEHLSDTDRERQYFHPEKEAYLSLNETIALYAWHCEHHLAHVRQAKKLKIKD